MRMHNSASRIHREEGTILFVTIMILFLVTIMGMAALSLSNIETLVVVNNKLKKESFFDAEAGVAYTLDLIERLNQNGTSPLPQSNCTNQTNVNPPGSFTFQISDICTTSKEDVYTFNSTGYSKDSIKSATSIINIQFEAIPIPAMNFAAFGNTKLDTKSSAQILSYNSNSSNPTTSDPINANFNSTGEADIGSNDWLSTKNNSVIDGNLVIGVDCGGANGTLDIHGGTQYSGEIKDNVGRIDPDPLEVTTIGSDYNPTTYATFNDNDTALVDPSDGIDSNSISLGNKETLTLSGKSGGSNFYISDIDLGKGSELIIDTANGPVNIYLTGGFKSHNQANVSVIDENGDPTYDATMLSIISDTTEDIKIQYGSDFTGLLYAPLANIKVMNSVDIFGAIWGYNVDLKNSGEVYYDRALAYNHQSEKYKELSLVSWREI